MIFALAASAVLATSCARPTGDFGRAEPNVIHDSVAPALGRTLAKRRDEPVSLFRRTDEELRLENVAWTIVRPMHTTDWISNSLVEGRRTRIFPEIDGKLDHRAYLFWLQLQGFRSSEAVWNRVIADIRADQGTVTPLYDQARLVYAIDQQRLAYLEKTEGIEPDYRQNTRARLLENEALIELALDSFQFRYAAYDFAIKRLILEIPSPRALIAEEELTRYGELIERGGERGLPFIEDPQLLSSRIGAGGEEAEKDDTKRGDGDARIFK